MTANAASLLAASSRPSKKTKVPPGHERASTLGDRAIRTRIVGYASGRSSNDLPLLPPAAKRIHIPDQAITEIGGHAGMMTLQINTPARNVNKRSNVLGGMFNQFPIKTARTIAPLVEFVGDADDSDRMLQPWHARSRSGGQSGILQTKNVPTTRRGAGQTAARFAPSWGR